jgi:hypothetical protein
LEGLFDRGENRRYRGVRLTLGAPEFRRNLLDQVRFPHVPPLLVPRNTIVCDACA